ncbi:uncharacterized protein LOC142930365 [Petromyzon marinus]|uniref:uncharacterized protein LOC142930365 n=1 Tax=Petromyzon marinus TaxID=7757 RepID=UPI003F6F5692
MSRYSRKKNPPTATSDEDEDEEETPSQAAPETGASVYEPLGTAGAMVGTEEGAKGKQPRAVEGWREVAGRLDLLLMAVTRLSLLLDAMAAPAGATDATRRRPVEETGRMTAAGAATALDTCRSPRGGWRPSATWLRPDQRRPPPPTWWSPRCRQLPSSTRRIPRERGRPSPTPQRPRGQQPPFSQWGRGRDQRAPFATNCGSIPNGAAMGQLRTLPPVREFVAARGDWAAFTRWFEAAFSSVEWTEDEALRALPTAFDNDALAAFRAILPEKRATLHQAYGEMAAVFDPPFNARRKFLKLRRREDETSLAYRSALMVLGQAAYPRMDPAAIHSLTMEKLLRLAQEKGVVLPIVERRHRHPCG